MATSVISQFRNNVKSFFSPTVINLVDDSDDDIEDDDIEIVDVKQASCNSMRPQRGSGFSVGEKRPIRDVLGDEVQNASKQLKLEPNGTNPKTTNKSRTSSTNVSLEASAKPARDSGATASSTVRSKAVSSTPETPSSIKAGQWITAPSCTKVESSVTPSTGARPNPFLMDDDSDDDRTLPSSPSKATAPVPNLTCTLRSNPSILKPEVARKEQERLESLRIRQETIEKKNSPTPKSGGCKTPVPMTPTKPPVVAHRVYNEKIAHLPSEMKPADTPSLGPSPLSAPSVKKAENVPVRPQQKSDPVQLRAASAHTPSWKRMASEPKAHAVGRPMEKAALSAISILGGPEVDVGKVRDDHNSRKSSEAERREGQTMAEDARQPEVVRKTAAAQTATNASNSAEANEKRRAKAQTDLDALRRHIAQKEAAHNARKAQDARREAEARERAEAKTVAEEKQWDDAQKARQAQDNQRKKLEEIAKGERESVAARERALLQLQHVAKAPGSTKPTDSPARSEARIGKPTAPPDPRTAGEVRNASTDTHINGNSTRAQQASDAVTSTEKPAAETVAQEARLRRIQAMKERNARFHQTEQESEDELEDRAVQPYRPTSKVPVSGNSVAADIERTEHLHASNHRDESRPDAGSIGHFSKHGRNLGKILPEDIQLLRWRTNGAEWPQMSLWYERSTGKKRAPETLRKRHRQIRDVLDVTSADKTTLDQVAEGDAGAIERLNRLVHGTLPAQERERDSRGHFIARPKVEEPRSSTSKDHPTSFQAPSLGLKSSNGLMTPTLGRQDSPIVAVRPTTGGKVLNEAYFKHLNESFLEAQSADSDDEETTPDREPSPITFEDSCYFVYRVERREIASEQMDEGESIDHMAWVVCSRTFESLIDANREASREAWLVRQDWKSTADPDKDWNMHQKTSEDGMKLFTMEWDDVGIVEVRVASFMRAYGDRILPQSKAGWAPKDIFRVMERRTTRSGDAMFEAVKERERERPVDHTDYTTLELANAEAVKYFVKRTFTPTSGRLTERDAEIQEVENELMVELNKDEDQLFYRKVEDPSAGETLEVWVEEGELAGPRNLD